MGKDIQDLMAIRDDIVAKLVPLIDGSTLETGDKYRMILQIAISNGSTEFFNMAQTQADKVDSPDERLRAYMDLLTAIDSEIHARNEEASGENDDDDASSSAGAGVGIDHDDNNRDTELR